MTFFTHTFVNIICLVRGDHRGAGAQNAENAGTGASGLPLPRFASLHTDEINLRTGPGTRYPIEWVYVREGLPVEVTAGIRDLAPCSGLGRFRGWLHKSALTGKRTLIITGQTRQVYEEMDEKSARQSPCRTRRDRPFVELHPRLVQSQI